MKVFYRFKKCLKCVPMVIPILKLVFGQSSWLCNRETCNMMTNSIVAKKRTGLRAHVCDLPRTSDSTLPKLPPNAKFYSRWKRNLQKLVLVSARHPLTRLILRSQAAVAFEKRRHSRSPHRWVIHPCSMLRYENTEGNSFDFFFLDYTREHKRWYFVADSTGTC